MTRWVKENPNRSVWIAFWAPVLLVLLSLGG